MTILIISSPSDPHARCVQWALRQHGVACEIIELTALPCNGHISISANTTPAHALRFAGGENFRQNQERAIDLSQVRAVWMRRVLLRAQHYDFSDVHEEDLSNVRHEVGAFIPGLFYALNSMLGDEVKWLNGFAEALAAQSKLLQLQLAQSVGFAVPATLMSNEPTQIRAFCAAHGGQIIVKSFKPKKWQLAQGIRVLPSTLVRSSDLQDDATLQLCPAIYQNHIKKQYELRVLVLGDELLAINLDSQAHAHSKTDWRTDANHGKMQAEAYTLDDATASLIRRFMRAIKLQMGSIDLIVTPEGKIVFLEVNEQGQFLFLEDMCPEVPALAAVCNFLTKAAGKEVMAAWPSYGDFKKSVAYAELQ